MCDTPGSKALDVMKNLQKKLVEFKRPEIPKKKVKPKILTEEKYIEELSKIIQRDFFPDLEKLKAQNEYLDAVDKNDVIKLREIYAKYSGNRPNSSRRQSPATFETPSSNFGGTPNFNHNDVNTKSKTDEEDALSTTSSTALSSIAEKHSLDSFLKKYTSEDNASFQDIIDAADEKLKQKFSILYNHESISYDKLSKALELPDIEKQFNNESDLTKPIETWTYKNKNYIMYIPDGVELTKEEKMEMANRKQEINYSNTRLHYNPFNENQNKETITELAKIQSKNLTGKVGVDGNILQQTNSNNNDGIRGFNFVKTPSPYPGEICSPLMTWGEIEGTPFRLDGSDTPIRLSAGPSFHINATPRREAIALELAEKAGERMRSQKQKALDTARRNIGSPYLRSSADKLAAMSPAVKRLATTKLGLRSSSILTPTPFTISKTPSPLIRKKTPVSAGSSNSRSTNNEQILNTPTSSPSLQNLNKSDLTDDLLKIPSKRQKASDFF